MSAREIEAAFAEAIADAGLGDTLIPADGKLHRFKVPTDKGRQRTGWAILHADGLPAGVAGDWRTGERITWKPDNMKVSVVDRRRLADLQRRREAEREETQKRAAAKAVAFFERLLAAPVDHPYLTRKQVAPGPCRITSGGALVVPVHDVKTGQIVSLQFIQPDGEKRFLAGGRTAGGCCILGGDDVGMVICEGYATGASIQTATGWTVVVAFNAGNLLAVAKAMREKHPERQVVVAADNDTETPGNPGVTKGTEAARTIGARLVVPPAPGDFNDLHIECDAGAVKAVITADGTPSFVKRDVEGIRAAKKKAAKAADAERGKADADRCKEERQHATDEKVRLAKEAAEELAQYRGLDLEVRVKARAKELDIGKDVLRKEVVLLQDGYKAADAMVTMPEVEPSPEAVDGDALLDELIDVFRAYVVLEYHDALVVSLYVVQTHSYDLWDFCARLNLTSPEPRCGKTTAQKVAGELVNKAKFADNISPSAVFRWVEEHKPTLIIDEVDQWLTLDSELIQLLTSGYEEGKKAVRNEKVGDTHVPVEFDLYCPCILAGIDGALKKPQLVDRCITVRLQRKARRQKTRRFRRRECGHLHELRSKIKRWVKDNEVALAKAQPSIPDEIDDDRAADKWEPLLAIADEVGGEYGVRAREAMLRFCRMEEDNQSVRVKLLADLKDIFNKHSAEKLLTEEILDELHAMESRPWPEFSRGKPLTSHGLARLLKPHKVRSKTVRSTLSSLNKKGYDIGDFTEAFRYLPQNVTASQTAGEAQASAENSCDVSEARDVIVTLPESQNVTLKPAADKGCDGVTDKTPPLDDGEYEPDAEDIEAERQEREAIQSEPVLSGEIQAANALLGEFPADLRRAPSMAGPST